MKIFASSDHAAQRHGHARQPPFRDARERNFLRDARVGRIVNPPGVDLAVVYMAAMTERDDCDDEDVVVDRIGDAVVADADSHAGTSLEGFGAWRTGILSKKRDRPTNAASILMVYSLQSANCRRAQLDLVGHTQPRSALT